MTLLRDTLPLALFLLAAAPVANAAHPTDKELDSAASSAHFATERVRRGNHYDIKPPWMTTRSAITYDFNFNSSALYDVGPNQLDYNKLPGFSDCGSIDLAQKGAMFGWRWNPQAGKLQISAYANGNGRHYWENNKDAVQLVELDPDEFMTFSPLEFHIEIQGDHYLFTIAGRLANGRVISSRSRLPRGCSDKPNHLKLGSFLYFGGTTKAPHDVYGYVKWQSR